MKRSVKIKRGNGGEIFQHDKGKFGIDWYNTESRYLQSITHLSKRDLKRFADRIYDFLEDDE